MQVESLIVTLSPSSGWGWASCVCECVSVCVCVDCGVCMVMESLSVEPLSE